jgi:hypothetical protein
LGDQRRRRWAGHVAHAGEKGNICRVLVRKPKGYSPLERCGHRCKDNYRINLWDTGWEGVNQIQLAQDDWWGPCGGSNGIWVP